MQLFSLFQYADLSTPQFQEPDYHRVFVGVFLTRKDAENAAKCQGLIPDIEPVTVGEYINPYQ